MQRFKRYIIMLLPSVVLFGFVLLCMVNTWTLTVTEVLKGTETSVQGLFTLSDELEEDLQEGFYGKESFINLNGLLANLVGINTLNERYKLANGYLAREEEVIDTTPYTDKLIALDDFLAERGIPFLYVLAPSSQSFYDATFLPGYACDAGENIDTIINTLTAAGVANLDMDAWFEENGWTMEEVFFITDHHWLPQAGLAATRCTMELLSSMGLATYDSTTLAEESYTITVLEDWFLGSHGKRTGTLFAGVDDFSIYVPNFATDYTYSALKRDSTSWTYRSRILNRNYSKATDYFNDNVYFTYMYADYPLRKTVNTEATNDATVLVIGDSYKVVCEYFLTTQFQTVYTIDLRYYTDGTLAEFIAALQPELVLMYTNSYALTDATLYDFGVEEYLAAVSDTDPNTEVLTLGDFTVVAEEDEASAFTVVYTGLEPGQTYTLTLDSTSYDGDADLYVQMSLQNCTTDMAVCNRYFDANSTSTQTWYFTVPEGADSYALCLYAGTKGSTEGVTAEVSNVRLQAGIPS